MSSQSLVPRPALRPASWGDFAKTSPLCTLLPGPPIKVPSPRLTLCRHRSKACPRDDFIKAPPSWTLLWGPLTKVSSPRLTWLRHRSKVCLTTWLHLPFLNLAQRPTYQGVIVKDWPARTSLWGLPPEITLPRLLLPVRHSEAHNLGVVAKACPVQTSL